MGRKSSRGSEFEKKKKKQVEKNEHDKNELRNRERTRGKERKKLWKTDKIEQLATDSYNLEEIFA